MNASEKKTKILAKRIWCILLVMLIGSTVSSMYASVNSGGTTEVSEAQQSASKVEGVVTDRSGEPLIGVSVAVKGTTNGAITDIDGKYTLNIPSMSGAVITFTYVGYKPQSHPAKSVINVSMDLDSKVMEEVVVVGYGTQKKENLTGAVASVDLAKTIESRPVSDIGRALQGAVPGLSITTSSGEIGGAPTIKIRGAVGSPNGTGKPLILLDNVEITDITLVNPDDIESISVLKDAASSSIYGARAAFGVILITSKNKKKNERLRVSYSNNFAVRKSTRKPEQLPAWQQAQINLEAERNLSPKDSYAMVGNIRVNETVIQKMKEWEEKYGGQDLGSEMVYGRDFEFSKDGWHFYRSWDWYEMFIRDWMPQQSHNLSISGGGEKTSFNIGLGYLHQEGVTKVNTDNFDRYNMSLGLNTEVNKWLNLRTNVMYTKRSRETPYVYNSGLYDYLYYLYRWQPFYPYGTYEGKPFRGAIAELEQATMVKETKDYWRLGGGATVNLMEGLTFDLDFVYNVVESRMKKAGNSIYGYNLFDGGINNLDKLAASYGDYTNAAYKNVYEDRGRTQTYTTNAVLTYSKKIKDHALKFMAGVNSESSEYTYLTAERKGLLDPALPELNLSGGDQLVGSSHSQWAVLGFFGRVNYAYKDKYLFELNARYDGSSKFPPNDRFALFTSVSLGYRLTEEPFMDVVKPYLSTLKLRGSYGEVGNQEVSSTEYLSTLTTTPNYTWMTGGRYNISVSVPTLANPNLSWETVRTVDLGLDARLFDDAFGVTFDWYNRYTSDILSAGKPLPSTIGANPPKQNFGELLTNGWELAVDYTHKFSNGLTLNVGAQLTDSKTEVNKWNRTYTTIPGYGSGGDGWYSSTNYYEGMTLGDIWGYRADRLFQESDFEDVAKGKLKEGIADHSKIYGKNLIQPGDLMFKDLDGDGKIGEGKVQTNDSGDKTIIGNVFPRYEFGLTLGGSYKGFDLNMFFQGVAKRSLWAGGNQVLPGYTSGEPFYKGAEDYWTPENPNAFYPRPMIYAQTAQKSFSISDRYMLNMSYLRCKALTVGYTLPKALVQKAYMTNVRVYFTGENLFEFDKMKPEIDPEIGIRVVGTTQDSRNFGRSYPYQRSYSLGMQVTF